MTIYKLTLSIVFSCADHEDEYDTCDDMDQSDWDALTQDERDNHMEGVWKDWAGNYIEGGWEEKSND